MALWYSLGIAFFAAIGTFLFVCNLEYGANLKDEKLNYLNQGVRYRYCDDE